MAALTFFTARLYEYAITADTADDPDFDPQIKGIHAGITFTPGVIEENRFTKLGDAIAAGTLTPNSALLALSPIRAKIDDGRLKLRADEQFDVVATVATYAALPSGLTGGDAGDGYIVSADGLVYVWSGAAFPADGEGEETVDQPDVRLVADTAVLDLPAGVSLGYLVDFDHVTYNAADQELPSFVFAAPATDVVVDLATVTRVAP